jgi:hypothetical protein
MALIPKELQVAVGVRKRSIGEYGESQSLW